PGAETPRGCERGSTWTRGRRTHGFPYRVRKKILQLYPVCNWPGCSAPSEEADHIVPYAEAVRLGWTDAEIDDVSNGQGLCREHHSIKTKEEARRGTQRRARKRQPERHPAFARRRTLGGPSDPPPPPG